MLINVKKAGILILAVLLSAVLLPAHAHAEEAWATLTAEPAAGPTLVPGDIIAYTLSVQARADGEQALRIQMPEGVTLSENAFVYRPVDDSGGTHSIIWGNDGCVVALPQLFTGDMLIFVAQVGDAQSQTLECTVTWDGRALSLSHDLKPAQDMPEPIAGPEAAPAGGQDGGGSRETDANADEPPSSLDDRQAVALLICTLLLSVSSTGFINAIRKYAFLKKNERISQQTEEED